MADRARGSKHNAYGVSRREANGAFAVIGLVAVVNWVIAIVVGIGATVITLIATSHRDTGLRRRVATYLAMRVAITLEAFAIACADLIGENQRAQPSNDDEGPRKLLPRLPSYPSGGDWRTLDMSLANRALAFRNDLAVSANAMYYEFDMNAKKQSDACDDQAAKRGVQAWDLARELRAFYRLPEYSPGFCVRSYLQKHIDELRSAEEAEGHKAQAMIDEVPSD
ncbi:MAG: hypothetical protein KGJ53_10560 [Alphaproteobacteria bacterium]|nr:hypothetical protein [Alphaproteobacteria bacterium]